MERESGFTPAATAPPKRRRLVRLECGRCGALFESQPGYQYHTTKSACSRGEGQMAESWIGERVRCRVVNDALADLAVDPLAQDPWAHLEIAG